MSNGAVFILHDRLFLKAEGLREAVDRGWRVFVPEEREQDLRRGLSSLNDMLPLRSASILAPMERPELYEID